MIASSYLVSFVLIRLMVILSGSAGSDIAKMLKEGTLDINFYIGRNIVLFGYHIHHFYFGLALILLAGWAAIVGYPRASKGTLAVIFGAGLGLFMDELGLLLTWGDYSSRASYFAGVFLLGVFLTIIYFPGFWQKIRS